jgi:hypothetical protein
MNPERVIEKNSTTKKEETEGNGNSSDDSVLMIIALEIIRQNGSFSLIHPLCQRNSDLLELVEGILKKEEFSKNL